MELICRLIVIAFGVWMLWVSGVLFTRPEFARTSLRKFASTNLINYTELGLRVIVGLGFYGLAPHTNYVLAFKIVGGFLALTAVLLMLIPRRWHHNYALWWADRLTHNQIKSCAPFSFVTGVMVIVLAVT